MTADRRSGRKSDGYAHCRPLFDELAALPAGHPDRRRLRELLILEHLPLAENIATRFNGRGQPRDDLVQVARMGLVKAVDRFDPAQGADFLSFAVPTVMGEIRRFFRDTGWAMRVPRALKELRGRLNQGTTDLAQLLGRAPTPTELAGHLGIDVETVRDGLHAANCYETSSLDRPAGDAGGATVADSVGEVDARIELVEDHQTIAPLLQGLPSRERAIVMMRFFDEMSQSQIAARVGVSQMQVSRILSKVLSDLRAQLGGPA
ncbi:SigB/SigF/SigG family RNA polymerase sigma factor [Amycolatopsis sp., V23-08]|uniref:SigB/SigF/SigG family RNA polymerase sigma factor n=1 Tax=Amycolatopsis heterodermiae TaxID=3110235 RepID=A0ABU5R427_9PSEU|nr:SigB/SigF/SigG family RNA polymerase sigma factor [Amycolatopsis sp., V23-08]MEA5360971.1 SigB/SigF/SigG family RNA polymerase sigma factor [Amycolatopsis sp., V23-08]